MRNFWEINNFSLAPDVRIVGATLTFSNIYDWTNELADALYIHLFDATPAMTPDLATIRSLNNVDADPGPGVKNYNTRLLQGADNQLG